MRTRRSRSGALLRWCRDTGAAVHRDTHLACFGDGDDVEASLGWTTAIDQRVTMLTNDQAWIEDGEEGIDDLPHDGDEREADPADYDVPGFIEGGQGL
ncbi:hypothetical protein [Mesorhizobium sp. f-mel]